MFMLPYVPALTQLKGCKYSEGKHGETEIQTNEECIARATICMAVGTLFIG